MKSSRPSCSTTSPPCSSSSRCAHRLPAPAGQHVADLEAARRRSSTSRRSSTCRRSGWTTASSSPCSWRPPCRGSCSGRPRASSCAPPGFNLTAARYAGMSAGGSMMLAMTLSGGLAGLGGGFVVIGTVGQMTLDLSGGLRLQRHRAGPAGRAATERRRRRGPALRGARPRAASCMGIQTGIPLDLLVFIMALVIMFVAAPGLVRSIWRIKVDKPAARDRPSSVPADGADMTAATVAIASRRRRPRRAQGAAQLRGSAAPSSPRFGLLRSTLASGSFDVAAMFSFWIVEQGGEAFTLRRPSVGILWIVGRRRVGDRRRPAAHPRAGLPVARVAARARRAAGSSAILAGAPERQGREHDERVRGQPRVRRPDLAGRLRRASCPSGAACSTSPSRARCSSAPVSAAIAASIVVMRDGQRRCSA